MADGPVIEKTQQDIKLSGMDEYSSEIQKDWTNGLQYAGNVLTEGGKLKTRLGVKRLTFVDSVAPVYRLGDTKSGLVVVGENAGSGFHLLQVDEKAATGWSKGNMPEFSVERIQAGADPSMDSSTAAASFYSDVTGVIGVCQTDRYNCIAYYTRYPDHNTTGLDGKPGNFRMTLDIIDRNSGNIVRSFQRTPSFSISAFLYYLVGVDNRYIHLYESYAQAANKPRILIVDTHSLPSAGAANRNLSTGSSQLTGATAGDKLIGAVSISGASVALFAAEDNTVPTIIKTTNGGTQTSASVTGFTTVSGIDTDGTNFYIAGIDNGSGDENFTPASLALTGWFRADFTGSPWSGTASAGTSGSNSMSEATNPPAHTDTLGGHTVATFDGTNDTLAGGTLADYFDVDGYSGAVLFYASAAAADDATNPYHNPNLFGDMTGGGFTGLSFSDAGVVFWLWDGTSNKRAVRACATGGWHLAMFGYDSGTNLMALQVDSGAATTTSVTVDPLFTTQSCGMGDGALSTPFNGKIAEVIVTDFPLSPTDFSNIKGYINSRYGLSL